MAKTELSKEIKIKIIEAAKDKYINFGRWGGLCSCILNNKSGVKFKNHLTDNKFPTSNCYNIGRYIPEFNITNAKKLAVKYNFPKPTGLANEFWWDRFNNDGKTARVAFLDALITEIKNND